MGYIYTVYFEGTTEVYSDNELSEEDVFDEAASIMISDARTRLDNHCDVENMEIISVEKEDY